MDQGFTLSFGAFIAGLVVVGWFLIQRELNKNDREDTKWKEQQEARTKRLEEEYAEMRIQLERKTSREELDKVYEAIKEVSNKFDSSNLKIIELLSTLVSNSRRDHDGFERPTR